MSKLEVPVLRSPSVLLRPFSDEDLSLVRAASEDPYIPLITTVPSPFSEEEGLAFIERQRSRAESGTGYPFVIADDATGAGIGFIGLWLRDLDEGRASLGYWIVAEQRGQRRSEHALDLVSRWALRELEIPRLELYVEPWNEASWRTAERVGFLREGLLRSWQQVGNERRAMYVYSLISSDLA